MDLAPYAVTEAQSKGRSQPEAPPQYRGEFQRDRDRIVHSSAFRRLEYKTQVFVNHEGDMFRTRLTHSIEVAQIARTIARALHLNEDLVEAIGLAHDLGHTPFGHAGQDALNGRMRDYGGFEHNIQSLRIVDLLEERYAEFRGLNLTFETREGILKHCSQANAMTLGELGRRFLQGTQPTLEAQVANIADEIAYNNHDIDDGIRSGLLDFDQLREAPLLAQHLEQVGDRYPGLARKRAVYEAVRLTISKQVSDLIDNSKSNIALSAVASVDQVREAGTPLIAFSGEMRQQHVALKQFLYRNMYKHYRVQRMAAKAEHIIQRLFDAFIDNPRLIPDHHRTDRPALERGTEDLARLVADYIAGMTDRFAILEHERLFNPAQLT